MNGAKNRVRLLLRFGLAAMAAVGVMLALAQDGSPAGAGAGDPEIYIASSPGSTQHVPTIIFVPGGPPQTLYVKAKNIVEPTGVGAFEVDLRWGDGNPGTTADVDPLSITDMFADTVWLASTGRGVSSTPALIEQSGNGDWRADVSATTIGASPFGPQGGGLLATLTIQPGSTPGGVFLRNQSFLLDTTGDAEPIPVDLRISSVIVAKCADVHPPGGDGVVIAADIAVLVLGFGSTPGDKDWNPALDLNDDGAVTAADIALIVIQFGRFC